MSYMSDDYCLNCAFHNTNAKYGCEMSEDIVVCSVKMRKKKQEKQEVKKI